MVSIMSTRGWAAAAVVGACHPQKERLEVEVMPLLLKRASIVPNWRLRHADDFVLLMGRRTLDKQGCRDIFSHLMILRCSEKIKYEVTKQRRTVGKNFSGR